MITMQAGIADSIGDWWHAIHSGCTGPRKKDSIFTAAYVIWDLWNERNRQIFQDKKLSPNEVAGKARDEISQLRLAIMR
jgi:hypothetical protein